MAAEDIENDVVPGKRFIAYGLSAMNRALVVIIISPTNYVYFNDIYKNTDVAKWYTGLQATAYNFGAVMSCLTIGFLLDMFGHPKRLIIILVFFHIIGMVLYSIPIGNVILLGQFFNGIGYALIVVIHYNLTVQSSLQDMGKYLSYFNLCGFSSQLFIFFVWFVYPKVNTYIGPWHIWSSNMPGVTMIFTYLITAVSYFVFYGPDTHKVVRTSTEIKTHVDTGKKKQEFKTRYSDIIGLLTSLDFIATMLHGIFLGCSRAIYAILVPVIVHDCFNLSTKYSVVITMSPAVAMAVMWSVLPSILRKVCSYDLAIIFTLGGLTLLAISCFLPKHELCFIIILTFFYISLFFIPTKRSLLVSMIAYTTPNELLGTAHSIYEMSIKLTGVFATLAIGVFAKHIRTLVCILFCFGSISTLLLLLQRKNLRKRVKKQKNMV